MGQSYKDTLEEIEAFSLRRRKGEPGKAAATTDEALSDLLSAIHSVEEVRNWAANVDGFGRVCTAIEGMLAGMIDAVLEVEERRYKRDLD